MFDKKRTRKTPCESLDVHITWTNHSAVCLGFASAFSVLRELDTSDRNGWCCHMLSLCVCVFFPSPSRMTKNLGKRRDGDCFLGSMKNHPGWPYQIMENRFWIRMFFLNVGGPSGWIYSFFCLTKMGRKSWILHPLMMVFHGCEKNVGIKRPGVVV